MVKDNSMADQPVYLDEFEQAALWRKSSRKRSAEENALQHLYADIQVYRDSDQARELLAFVASFPSIAPFNAMLVHAQRPGCGMVATAANWEKLYNRSISFTARPLIVMNPFGPIGFVYDVGDTEHIPGKERKDIPQRVLDPFGCEGKALPPDVLSTLLGNLPGQGIISDLQHLGNQMGGSIQVLGRPYFQYHRATALQLKPVRAFYGIIHSDSADEATDFATISHELGHLFCGHLGHPDDKRAIERKDLAKLDSWERRSAQEFEAETVSWLVCSRLGIDTPSADYLSGYLSRNKLLPKVNLPLVFKAATRIETLYKAARYARRDLVIDEKKQPLRNFIPWESRECRRCQ